MTLVYAVTGTLVAFAQEPALDQGGGGGGALADTLLGAALLAVGFLGKWGLDQIERRWTASREDKARTTATREENLKGLREKRQAPTERLGSRLAINCAELRKLTDTPHQIVGLQETGLLLGGYSDEISVKALLSWGGQMQDLEEAFRNEVEVYFERHRVVLGEAAAQALAIFLAEIRETFQLLDQEQRKIAGLVNKWRDDKSVDPGIPRVAEAAYKHFTTGVSRARGVFTEALRAGLGYDVEEPASG